MKKAFFISGFLIFFLINVNGQDRSLRFIVKHFSIAPLSSTIDTSLHWENINLILTVNAKNETLVIAGDTNELFTTKQNLGQQETNTYTIYQAIVVDKNGLECRMYYSLCKYALDKDFITIVYPTFKYVYKIEPAKKIKDEK